jgi:hypothetical protein
MLAAQQRVPGPGLAAEGGALRGAWRQAAGAPTSWSLICRKLFGLELCRNWPGLMHTVLAEMLPSSESGARPELSCCVGYST